jgi:dTDP-4-dehydrorhamnose 3,5-epimerase
MISGVEIKKLKALPDERGRLMEILRSDDDLFIQFGQIYMTTGYPGVVKAWHHHKKQWDNFCVLKGMLKVVLYDGREDSPTKGELMELFMGDFNPILVRIPPQVFHGFKCISEQEAILINIPTETYNYDSPDEFRIHPHDNDIPYSWERRDG